MGKSEKHGKKSKKKHKHKRKKEHKLKASKQELKTKKPTSFAEDDDDFSVPVELMSNKSHAPETQEEFDRRQSVIRREVDPKTGRVRLIKGDGEILEEIVSRDRHLDINKSATRTDASLFEQQAVRAAKRQKK